MVWWDAAEDLAGGGEQSYLESPNISPTDSSQQGLNVCPAAL